MQPGRTTGTPQKASGKVRLRSLSDLDMRTRAAREVLRLKADIAADLGGVAQLSAMQLAVIEQAAITGAMLAGAAHQRDG